MVAAKQQQQQASGRAVVYIEWALYKNIYANKRQQTYQHNNVTENRWKSI